MHDLITNYPGAPGFGGPARWWHLLDEEELAVRRERRAELPGRLLRWNEPPPDPGAIEELRVISRAADTKALPGWVASLPRVVYLGLPIRFAKTLDDSAIPGSVRVLDVLGSGTATVPKKSVFAGVTFLLSDAGTVKFVPENFPSLDRLSLNLDRPQKMLDVVSSYDGLRALHLSSVHADDLFDRIGGLPLRYLGLVGGRLGSMQGIGVLQRLTSLQLKNLSNLASLSGIAALDALEELSIGYCNGLRDVRDIARLAALRRLMLFGMRDVGISEILPILEAKGLEQLSLGGAT